MKDQLSKNEIRGIFMRNGFTVKEGCEDLKDYVYAAAYDLLKAQEERHRTIEARLSSIEKLLSADKIDWGGKVQTYNFGKRLKELRSQRSLTQSELEKLCGLPSMVLPHYENGTRKPGLDNILLICKGLKCSATDLLCI